MHFPKVCHKASDKLISRHSAESPEVLLTKCALPRGNSSKSHFSMNNYVHVNHESLKA